MPHATFRFMVPHIQNHHAKDHHSAALHLPFNGIGHLIHFIQNQVVLKTYRMPNPPYENIAILGCICGVYEVPSYSFSSLTLDKHNWTFRPSLIAIWYKDYLRWGSYIQLGPSFQPSYKRQETFCYGWLNVSAMSKPSQLVEESWDIICCPQTN